MKVEANVLYNELVASSAFQGNSNTNTMLISIITLIHSIEFERQSCQLQIVDLSYMDSNELYVFFINVHNTLCIHACLKEITSTGKGN